MNPVPVPLGYTLPRFLFLSHVCFWSTVSQSEVIFLSQYLRKATDQLEYRHFRVKLHLVIQRR